MDIAVRHFARGAMAWQFATLANALLPVPIAEAALAVDSPDVENLSCATELALFR